MVAIIRMGILRTTLLRIDGNETFYDSAWIRIAGRSEVKSCRRKQLENINGQQTRFYNSRLV